MPEIDAYDLRTGQPLKPELPERPPLEWKPEQTIVLHTNDYIEELQVDLSNHLPVTALTKVDIHLGSFYFDDGMRWNLGRYSVPDPEDPGKFKYLPPGYFPGKRGQNWPPGYNQQISKPAGR